MYRGVNIAMRRFINRANKQYLPRAWLMTDAVRMTDPVASVLRLPPGCGVIVRHTEPGRLRAIARVLVPVCRRRGVTCLIAGDWRLAAQTRADGLHLPEQLARPGAIAAALGWRRRAKRLLTTSAHGHMAVKRAAPLKPDGILIAPVFATASHPDARPLGAVRFAALVRQAPGSVLALGGVTLRTYKRLAQSGVHGFAGIGWMEE